MDKRFDLQNARYRLQNDLRGQLLQTLIGMFAIAGAVAAWWQIRVAREGQITERFTHAIDQIGDDKLDVRIGGLFTLERIAKSSPSDQVMINEVLSAFVRGHGTWVPNSPADPRSQPLPAVDPQLPWLRDRAHDIQIAMTILGRCHVPRHARAPLNRVDLRRSGLTRVQFPSTYLMITNFSGSWMKEANFEEAKLHGSDLRQTVLSNARMSRATLREAHLDDAILDGADLRDADLSNAALVRADLRGARLARADLRGADLTDAKIENADFTDVRTDAATLWPD